MKACNAPLSFVVRTKKHMRILYATLLILLIACKKTNDTLPDQSTIALGNCMLKNFGQGPVSLCFDSLLSDSRCPANAMCVWQGEASGKFTFSFQNQQVKFRLSTLIHTPYFTNDTTIAGYRIRLVDIQPYPGMPPATPTALVEISH